MKKTLFALAALSAVTGIAHADSSVELYGVLDVAVGTVSHSYNIDPTFPGGVNPVSATKAANSVTGMLSGGIQDSRWGLRGSEDLGQGLKAIFTLESGINLPTGALNSAATALTTNNVTSTSSVQTTSAANSSLNGQLFNRQAWVGLSDATYGTVKLGRNYAPIYDIAVDYDPVQNAQLFSPIGFSGTLGGGGGVSENTRQDNSVKYSNKIGQVNFGAMYKMGNQAGSFSAQSAYAFNLGYEDAKFGVQAAYQNATDALKTGTAGSTSALASPANSLNVTAYNTSAWFLAAKYKVTTEGTIKVGYERYTLKAASDTVNATTLPVIYGFATNTSTGGVSSYAGADQPTDIYFIGGDYNLTSALNLAAGYYLQKPAAYSNKIGVTNTYYSFLADYKFSKRTDVYAGLMFSNFSDTSNSSSPNNGYIANNSIYAVGIRHKF